MSRIGSGSDKADSVNHVPGFWLRLEEPDARAIAAGKLPERVRVDVEAMMYDYDAHMLRCAAQILAAEVKRRTHG